MSTNKHATIRYHALDKCFSNFGKRYYIDDLVIACNEALYEHDGIKDGVKKRQISYDIIFMESEHGWSIPLDRLPDGKRIFYRYSDRSYSIKNQAINETELKQLRETISVLTRFKGMPQFVWMEEILVRIESTLKDPQRSKSIVDFEQNQYLRGLNHFTALFNSIVNSQTLKVDYQGFKQLEKETFTFHPYFLKQYNSRWFVFGYNDKFKSISNLALDRIQSISQSGKKYIENKEIDFDEYFEDALGVTLETNKEPVKILLQIAKDQWPYIETKPIHGTQKVVARESNSVIISLDLILNYELINLIFSLGEKVKVLEPEELKHVVTSKAKALLNNYL